MKRILPAAVLLALGAAACDGSKSTGVPSVDRVVISTTLQPIGIGETLQLSAEARSRAGEPVPGTSIAWSTLDPGVASVTLTGVVTGVASGTARIVAAAAGKADTVAVVVQAAANTRTFNVSATSACSAPKNRQFRLAATSANALFYHDVANPSGGFSDADYESIAATFESQVWPVVVGTFGPPSDIDGNGKVIVLYTSAVNELTEPGSGSYVGGFFWSRDLFPRTATPQLGACATSNQGELFYMLAADPNGEVNGNVRTAAFVRRATLGTLAHELQHLLNASRRIYVNNASALEEVWLDEGLAHASEELVFYGASGLGARQNLRFEHLVQSQTTADAFNRYGGANTARFQTYLEAPQANSPIGTDNLATRGSAWSFLRYAADRRAGDDRQLFRQLLNTSATGLDNLRAALGTDPLPWFRDWGVAVYADDAVPGVPALFTQPSWNFRDIYGNQAFAGRYPLATVQLSDGVTRNVDVRAASSAYLRFGVPAGGEARVRVALGGAAGDPPCTPLSLAVGASHQGPLATVAAFCLDGGAAGAEYVLIPFHRSGAGASTAAVGVVGTGIIAVSGPPTPSVSPTGAGSGLLVNGELVPDRAFEARLRARERAELEPLMRRGAGGGARMSATASQVEEPVQLTLMRTR